MERQVKSVLKRGHLPFKDLNFVRDSSFVMRAIFLSEGTIFLHIQSLLWTVSMSVNKKNINGSLRVFHFKYRFRKRT